MEINFNIPGLSLLKGQTIQGEVVGSNENGSIILVNGIPVSTEKSLPRGKNIHGVVEKVDGGLTTVRLSDTAQVAGGPTLSDKILESLGLLPDESTRFLLEVFRKSNIPITRELFQRGQEVLRALNLGIAKVNEEALGLLLLRGLPASAYHLLKDYFEGKLQFDHLLTSNMFNLSQIKGKLVLGEFFIQKSNEELLRFLKAFSRIDEGIPQTLAKNLTFQELFSIYPRENQDGRVYFQWPLFWKDQELPDTLEGEAFFSGNGEGKAGFSLRILVNPPSLGPLELGLHRIQDSIWVHFGIEGNLEENPIKKIFPDLKKALEALGWKTVRITIGEKQLGDRFLSPFGKDRQKDLISKLDIKV